MKLVFLYGPPAVGKYTVATALAELTGFKLFHNHLTVDVVRSVFPDRDINDSTRVRLLEQSRLLLIEAAAQENIDVIFTFAYSGAVDDPWVAEVIQVVTSNGGIIDFVQLTAPDEVLLNRIENADRKEMGKLASREVMKHQLSERDHSATIGYRHHLRLDTATTSAADNALAVAKAFSLPLEA